MKKISELLVLVLLVLIGMAAIWSGLSGLGAANLYGSLAAYLPDEGVHSRI